MVDLLDAGLPAPAAGVFTTRTGGVSAPPWDSADLALHVGDDPGRVAANRERLAGALDGVPLVFAEQVHGSGVAVVGTQAAGDTTGDTRGDTTGDRAAARTGTGAVPSVDALVTGAPGLALVVLAADCLPVLLADPAAGVVAAAHAGRAGLAGGVLQATLAAMAGLGADPASTTAVLGPAVCGGCYELPAELADEVGRQVPGCRCTTRSGSASVDLSAGAETLLRRAGLAAVRRVGGCTAEQPGRFYSYRRDGVTGRHAGVVRLVR